MPNWYWLATVIFETPGGDPHRVCDLCHKYLKALPDGIYANKAREKHELALRQIILPDYQE